MAISTSKIFLESQNGVSLIPLTETAYEKETHLQELLAQYPDLIPGDQIAQPPQPPCRWLLISREMAVSDGEAEGRWSLDHLFVDQQSVPTFVECKRSSDTRGRREVVAQMLDYAANGVAYWSTDQIRAAAVRSCEAAGTTLDQALENLIGPDVSADAVEEYWQRLADNLKNRRIRLIFVADKIAPELKKLVEFMNEEMTNVEVLAVEVKQYLEPNAQHKVLVPILIGATEQAQITKQAGARNKLTIDQFIGNCPELTKDFFSEVIQRTQKLDAVIGWGTVGFTVRIPDEEKKLHSLVYCYPPDSFSFSLDNNLSTDEAFKISLRRQLLASGLVRESGKFTIRAPITAATTGRLLDVFEEAVKSVKASFGQFHNVSTTCTNTNPYP